MDKNNRGARIKPKFELVNEHNSEEKAIYISQNNFISEINILENSHFPNSQMLNLLQNSDTYQSPPTENHLLRNYEGHEDPPKYLKKNSRNSGLDGKYSHSVNYRNSKPYNEEMNEYILNYSGKRRERECKQSNGEALIVVSSGRQLKPHRPKADAKGAAGRGRNAQRYLVRGKTSTTISTTGTARKNTEIEVVGEDESISHHERSSSGSKVKEISPAYFPSSQQLISHIRRTSRSKEKSMAQSEKQPIECKTTNYHPRRTGEFKQRTTSLERSNINTGNIGKSTGHPHPPRPSSRNRRNSPLQPSYSLDSLGREKLERQTEGNIHKYLETLNSPENVVHMENISEISFGEETGGGVRQVKNREDFNWLGQVPVSGRKHPIAIWPNKIRTPRLGSLESSPRKDIDYTYIRESPKKLLAPLGQRNPIGDVMENTHKLYGKVVNTNIITFNGGSGEGNSNTNVSPNVTVIPNPNTNTNTNNISPSYYQHQSKIRGRKFRERAKSAIQSRNSNINIHSSQPIRGTAHQPKLYELLRSNKRDEEELNGVNGLNGLNGCKSMIGLEAGNIDENIHIHIDPEYEYNYKHRRKGREILKRRILTTRKCRERESESKIIMIPCAPSLNSAPTLKNRPSGKHNGSPSPSANPSASPNAEHSKNRKGVGNNRGSWGPGWLGVVGKQHRKTGSSDAELPASLPPNRFYKLPHLQLHNAINAINI